MINRAATIQPITTLISWVNLDPDDNGTRNRQQTNHSFARRETDKVPALTWSVPDWTPARSRIGYGMDT
jgi:hypothetical protein